MALQTKTLVNYRGTDEFEAAMDALAEKLGHRDRCALLDTLISDAGRLAGVAIPPRIGPLGGYHGRERKPKKSPVYRRKSRRNLQSPVDF